MGAVRVSTTRSPVTHREERGKGLLWLLMTADMRCALNLYTRHGTEHPGYLISTPGAAAVPINLLSLSHS